MDRRSSCACCSSRCFVKYGVNVVFSGHDHVYERVKPQKGIYYFVSGAAGQLRKGNMRPDDETAAYFDQDQSFMLVEVSGDDMYLRAISRTGKTVDSGKIHREAKVARPNAARVMDEEHDTTPAAVEMTSHGR